MKWLRGYWVTWALVGAGLLTTSCAGVVGAGVGVAVVGAGVLSMTCYDRVSVTVTDKVTGTKLCDAKVTFTEDGSETTATSCYQAALSDGHYKLRVERRGLVPYEVPIDVDTGSSCKHATQTMWIALDRPNLQQPPQQITPPAPVASAPPPAVSVPVPVTVPAPATTPAPAASSAPAAPAAPNPASSGSFVAPPPATPSAAPPPAAGTFPSPP